MQPPRRSSDPGDSEETTGVRHAPGVLQLGSNHLGVREFNERLILRLIHRAGSLPKAEIARITHLSAQTATVIVNRLLREKLLVKQAKRREKGKVGQPAVPVALNPDGAYSIGVKIGRRSLDVIMVDFLGQVRTRRSHRYEYPIPEEVFARIESDLADVLATLNESQKRRVAGIGVTVPFYLGSWPREIRAPDEILASWDEIDIQKRIAKTQVLPVWFSNDATAACVADLGMGNGARFNHYLYFFVGTFIGGGVVLNGTLFGGSSGNAGAIGSMPLPPHYSQLPEDIDQPTVQLIHCASRFLLDDRFRTAGFDPVTALPLSGNEPPHGLPEAAQEILDDWLERGGDAIAFAIVAALSVIDFEGIVIDGAFPASIAARLTEIVEGKLKASEMRGVERPQLHAGKLGDEARALGGALLPLYWNFAPDRDVLLKLRNVAP